MQQNSPNWGQMQKTLKLCIRTKTEVCRRILFIRFIKPCARMVLCINLIMELGARARASFPLQQLDINEWRHARNQPCSYHFAACSSCLYTCQRNKRERRSWDSSVVIFLFEYFAVKEQQVIRVCYKKLPIMVWIQHSVIDKNTVNIFRPTLTSASQPWVIVSPECTFCILQSTAPAYVID